MLLLPAPAIRGVACPLLLSLPTPAAPQAILPALLACIGRALNEGDETAAQVGSLDAPHSLCYGLVDVLVQAESL